MGGIYIKSAFVYIILIVIFLLVTFFGLGPVFFADGTLRERMITLAVVVLIYLILIWITAKYMKRKPRS